MTDREVPKQRDTWDDLMPLGPGDNDPNKIRPFPPQPRAAYSKKYFDYIRAVRRDGGPTFS